MVEDATTGFCGAVLRWENGLVLLEDRRGKVRSLRARARGSCVDGQPVTLQAPVRAAPTRAKRTASGSVATPGGDRAKVALPSRIYVEGRHDAELVERIWGDDLRHVGVVVEFLGGIDDLAAVVEEFAPGPGRRLGVLADHLVPGSKETRIAQAVERGRHGAFVRVLGHPYVDVWQAVKPERVGLKRWPDIPRDVEWKAGDLRGAQAPARRPGRHRPRLAGDPRAGAFLVRHRAPAAHLRRGADRLRDRRPRRRRTRRPTVERVPGRHSCRSGITSPHRSGELPHAFVGACQVLPLFGSLCPAEGVSPPSRASLPARDGTSGR